MVIIGYYMRKRNEEWKEGRVKNGEKETKGILNGDGGVDEMKQKKREGN